MNSRRELPLLAAVFLDMLGFGMIIPDIQLRAEKMGAPGWMIGALLASTFVIQLIASQWWGRLSDRIGRKSVFLACTGMSSLSMALYALAGGIPMLFASRIVAGLGAANVAAAQASMADLSEEQNRAAAMGRMSAALTLGLVVGPVLGGFVAENMGSHWVGWLGAGSSIFGLLLVAIWTPNTKGAASDEKPAKQSPWQLIKDYPLLTAPLLAATVAWFSLATLEGTFGRLINRTLGLGPQGFGIIFSFESVIGVVVQALLLKWIIDRLGERKAIPWAYLLQGAGLILTPFAPTFALLFVASGLYALGSAVANPSVNAVCSRLVDANRQGELFGLIQSTRAVGFIVGPLLGGRLFDWQPAAPYILAGGVCAAAAILMSASLPKSKLAA